MHYSEEIVIDRPLAEVVAAFEDPAGFQAWMPDLLGREPVSGAPGEVGSTTRLKVKMGGRTVEMLETVTVRELPRRIVHTYAASNVHNEARTTFTELGPASTKYTSEQTFTLSGPMKLVGFLMPEAFRKETRKTLDRFKAYVESRPRTAGTG